MKDQINQINKELKVYINESSFISQKCRNKVLKIFAEVFGVSLDIDTYKNVDLSFQEDFQVLYREDLYKSNVTSMKDLEEKYHSFQEKADVLIRRKNVDFQGRRNFNNFTNLIMIIFLFLLMIGILLLGIFAFFTGRYFDCLWLVVFIIPSVVPRIRENLKQRVEQAKNYIKSLLKKVK
jgi:hypothetical protein